MRKETCPGGGKPAVGETLPSGRTGFRCAECGKAVIPSAARDLAPRHKRRKA
jgi:tRNA(Ile2) C34 agmatinyltransferase TiaS